MLPRSERIAEPDENRHPLARHVYKGILQKGSESTTPRRMVTWHIRSLSDAASVEGFRMPTPSPPLQDVTQLLIAWGNGNQAALDRLMPLVYTELRQLARRYMRREISHER